MARKGTGEYPAGWPEFARQVKEEAGWYAFRYLGELLTREEVMARLDELLALEGRVVRGEFPLRGSPGGSIVMLPVGRLAGV